MLGGGKEMTVKTKLPYDKDYIEQFSKDRNEPEWMKYLRLQAIEQANELELPQPDKTRIGRWNFTNFKHASEGAPISSLAELPEQLQDFIDQDNLPKNILIERNQSVAFAKLSDELKNKGVIFTDIATALVEHEELVKKYFMKDVVSVDEHKLTALHAAMVNGGVFIYVPK